MNTSFIRKTAIILLCGILFPAFAQEKTDTIRQWQEKFGFSTVKENPYTSVKNQSKSGTCWDYAGTSFIESEMLRMGKKPIDIAEMFTVYHAYREKAQKYVRLHGECFFSPGGEGPDVFEILKKYGAVPQDVYSGLTDDEKLNNHSDLHRSLTIYLDTLTKSKIIRGDWKKGFDGILDRYLGCPPSSFSFQGKQYSPRTFADNVIGLKLNEYTYITSWANSPFYEKIFLEVPDNWTWEKYYNLPLDEMILSIDYALENGYTVLWSADMSEKYFSVPMGIAVVPQDEKDTLMFNGPKAEKIITEDMRQKAFDNYSTVDDHVMHIVGIAKDLNGKIYYLVKNSWGTKEKGFDGMYYISEAFMRYKTISIILHNNALPSEISKKLK